MKGQTVEEQRSKQLKKKANAPSRRPQKMTEDQADALVSLRRLKTEPRSSLNQVLRENGLKLDR